MAAPRGRQITNFGGFFDPFAIGSASIAVGYREIIQFTVAIRRSLSRSVEIDTQMSAPAQIMRGMTRRVKLGDR